MEKMVCSASEFTQMLENILNDDAVVPLCVTGTSMRPFLLEGRDTVWLSRFAAEDLKRGDMVLFKRSDGTAVLHRIRKVMSDGNLLMNGDAQSWCETISASQVIAVVQYIERGGKKFSCADKNFRLRSEMWQLSKPARPLLLKIWRKLK